MKLATILSAAVFALAAPTIALADNGEGEGGQTQASKYQLQLDDSNGLEADLYLNGKVIQTWKGDSGSLSFGFDTSKSLALDNGDQKFNFYTPGSSNNNGNNGHDGEGEGGDHKSKPVLYGTLDLSTSESGHIEVSFHENGGNLSPLGGDNANSVTVSGDWQSAFHKGDGNSNAYDMEFRGNAGGSNATAAPEPATWAMMLIGFAGFGVLGARKARGLRAVTAASRA